MLFSCSNNTQQVRDFLASKNLPIGTAKTAYHVYKDSGKITSKLLTPLRLDFSNREQHEGANYVRGRVSRLSKKGDKIFVTFYSIMLSTIRCDFYYDNCIASSKPCLIARLASSSAATSAPPIK